MAVQKALGGALVALLAAGTVAMIGAAPAGAVDSTSDPAGDSGGGIDVVQLVSSNIGSRVVFGASTSNNVFLRPDDALIFFLDLDSDRQTFEGDIVFDPTAPDQSYIECDSGPSDDSTTTHVVSGNEIHVSVSRSQLQECGLSAVATSFEWGAEVRSFLDNNLFDDAPNGYDNIGTPGVVEHLNDAEPAPNFVSGLYSDFLDRSADSAGLNFWSEQTMLGVPRAQVAMSFAQSDEWIGVTVDDMYQTTLGRPADADGRAFWISQIRNGRSVPSVGGFFYGSDEYFDSSGGTASDWIDALYTDILGRSADQGGHDFWVQKFNEGMPRDQIALNFFQSIENRRQRVTRLYDLLLDRTPDAGGLEFWAQRILTDGDLALAAFLAGSDEYFNLQQP